MKKLEEFVIEKLRVTKSSYEIDLLALMESKTTEEYESKCIQLIEDLKDDSDLPIAELEDFKNNLKTLPVKYKNDTFLWILPWNVCYGTFDTVYCITWSEFTNKVKNYKTTIDGFKELRFNNQEMYESGGVFIITKNDELMEQIDYLIQQVESSAK